MSSNPAANRASDVAAHSRFAFWTSGYTLPLTLAALTAFATVVFTSYKFPGATIVPVACAVLLFATRCTTSRIPRTAAYRYGLRFFAVTLAFLIHGLPETTGSSFSFFEPEYTRLASSILAAELVVRAWLRTDPAHLPRERRMFLLITALIMTAASNTYDRFPFQLYAPVYTIFVALALRSLAFDSPQVVVQPSPPAPPRRLPLQLLRTLAFLLTLLLGAATVLAVTKYDNAITTWAFNLLRDTKSRPRSSAIGFSTAPPRLGSVFNPDATLDRALLIEGPGAVGDRHVRILAFDTYDHTTWQPAITHRAFRLVPRSLSAAATTQPTTASTHALHITRLTDLADLLPVPSEATALHINADLDRDALAALRDRTGGENPPFDAVVPARSSPLDAVPLAPPPAADARKLLLAIPPEIDPRVSALARELTAADATPAQKIFHLAQHLRATHAYSLSFEPAANTDPLNDFILNGRAAHCQYFASALVILARAAGVPARLVTGYYAHEPYGDNATIVRERDAHAWAECYLDDVAQWVTADATPAAGRPDGLFPDPPRWRRILESLRDLPTKLRAWFTAIPRTRLYTIVALTAGAALLVTLARNLQLRRRRRVPAQTDAYPPPAPEILEAATRFERWLRTQGHPTPATLTWRAHAQSLAPNPHVLAFLTTYDAARFGHATSDLLTRLHTTLTTLESPNPNP